MKEWLHKHPERLNRRVRQFTLLPRRDFSNLSSLTLGKLLFSTRVSPATFTVLAHIRFSTDTLIENLSLLNGHVFGGFFLLFMMFPVAMVYFPALGCPKMVIPKRSSRLSPLSPCLAKKGNFSPIFSYKFLNSFLRLTEKRKKT